MTTITEIIARLGHACDEAWADCRGFYPAIHGVRMVCAKHRGHSGACESEDGHRWKQHLPPLAPLPSTLAEWSAEWEREHPGEPGPVASWHSPEKRSDGVPYVAWYVDERVVRIRVGTITVERWRSDRWTLRADGVSEIPIDAAMSIELGRLMQAVDGAR